MNYDKSVKDFYLSLIKISIFGQKNTLPPESMPEWLKDEIRYIYSEFANSRDEIYYLTSIFESCSSFEDVKQKFMQNEIFKR